MSIEQIRYANLQLLVDREGGLRKGGLAKVAERIGRSQGQLSHIGGAVPTKNIGSALARHIETSYGLPPGWMDRPHAGVDGVDQGLESTSQLVSETRRMIAAVVRLTDYVRDVALEAIPADKQEAVLDAAIRAVESIGPEKILDGTGLPDAAREVAARIRSK